MAYTTINDPSAYFKVQLYTGNNTTDTAITFDGDTDMSPNFVWIKCRSSANSSALFNSVIGPDYHLVSNDNAAQAGDGSYFKSFDSDGFTLGIGGQVNDSATTYVAWCWKETADAGFDIVTYTGDGSNRTISHSLSAVPDFIAVKNNTSARSWINGLTSLGWDKNLYFDMSNAENDSADMWNDTAPTSSVFTVGTSVAVNEDTDSIIAYLWSGKQGFSKFGKYTGNGSADGTFVFCGFRPAMVFLKKTSGAALWYIHDNKRNPYNVMDKRLYVDNAAAEASANELDFLSNGFKLRSTETDINGSGSSYVYMVWAEAPFVNSEGVPCNAR